MNYKNIISFIINKHLIIVRYGLVLVAAMIIVSLFPQSNFKYNFELGKPWQYENLYAPFTFAIKKSKDSIDLEKKRRLDEFEPFYRIEEEVENKVMDNFVNRFTKVYDNFQRDTTKVLTLRDSIRLAKTATFLLDTVYRVGVIMWEEEHQHFSGTDRRVNLFVENTVTPRPSKLLFDGLSACKFINQNIRSAKDSSLLFLIDLLCEDLAPNIVFDKATNDRMKEELLDIPEKKGSVQKEELVVTQGKRIEIEEYQKLVSLRNIYENRQMEAQQQLFLDRYTTKTGHFILVLLIFGVFIVFMLLFENSIFTSLSKLIFILVTIILFLYLVKIVSNITQISMPNLSLYVIPFCTIPIIIRTFFGSRMALYTFLVVLLLTGLMMPISYEFLFLHLVAGLVAIIANMRTYYWSQFFVATAFIFLTYCIGYLGFALIQENSWQNINLDTYGWLAVNAFLTLLAYPLIPVFEKIFGFVSNITLIEMSDLNRPLLKKLSQKAPGTFWHSLQVANLAEAAAAEIGANALLAKVGALYHDIGKMERPVYFIENQKTEINPHDDLSDEESARIIIEHVTHGIEMAKKEGLPNLLIDFIRTHHGNTRTEYFYRNYVKAHPHEKVDERKFRYPGPIPYSKETAVVMLADSIEAASKSFQNPSEEEINKLVEAITDHKIKENQFVNCNISFKDIRDVKNVFKKQLKSLYHIRISYPELDKKRKK